MVNVYFISLCTNVYEANCHKGLFVSAEPTTQRGVHLMQIAIISAFLHQQTCRKRKKNWKSLHICMWGSFLRKCWFESWTQILGLKSLVWTTLIRMRSLMTFYLHRWILISMSWVKTFGVRESFSPWTKTTPTLNRESKEDYHNLSVTVLHDFGWSPKSEAMRSRPDLWRFLAHPNASGECEPFGGPYIWCSQWWVVSIFWKSRKSGS